MAKILIVDDEISLQRLLRTILEEEGHQVSAVDTGIDVFSSVVEQKPDLMLLDVMLPGLDGLSLQKSIAGDPALAKIPVIVMTAQGAFLKSFEAFPQVVAMLKKPFRNQELLSAVRAALGGKAPAG